MFHVFIAGRLPADTNPPADCQYQAALLTASVPFCQHICALLLDLQIHQELPEQMYAVVRQAIWQGSKASLVSKLPGFPNHHTQ
jgi:hypothetical protein